MTDVVAGRTSLLVLSYNSGTVLAECLQAALAQRDADVEVLCLDNASSDDSVAVAARFTAVCSWQNGANVGYAGGMNQLFGASSGEFVVFLNADCVLAPDFCTEAVQLFRALDGVDVLGAAVRRPDGGDDGSVLAVSDTMRVRLRGVPSEGEWQHTFKANGSCPVVRRKLLDRMADRYGVPAFDPVFDTYGEDVDFAFRAAAVGAVTVCSSRLRAIHARSHVSQVSVLDKRGRLRVNVIAARHINARRHLPALRLAVVLPVLLAQDLALALVQLVRGDTCAGKDVLAAWRRLGRARSWRWRRAHTAYRAAGGLSSSS